jgi:hypothetical protein
MDVIMRKYGFKGISFMTRLLYRDDHTWIEDWCDSGETIGRLGRLKF